LIDAVSGGSAVSYVLRSSLERGAGVASLATLGLSFFILLGHRAWVARLRPLPRPLIVLATALMGLTLFRAFAWAERLAFVEVVCVFLLFGIGHSERLASRRIFLAAFPIVGAFGLVLFFGAAEQVRDGDGGRVLGLGRPGARSRRLTACPLTCRKARLWASWASPAAASPRWPAR
jgi:hypothetical protein